MASHQAGVRSQWLLNVNLSFSNLVRRALEPALEPLSSVLSSHPLVLGSYLGCAD